jgi:hypothetical protein
MSGHLKLSAYDCVHARKNVEEPVMGSSIHEQQGLFQRAIAGWTTYGNNHCFAFAQGDTHVLVHRNSFSV